MNSGASVESILQGLIDLAPGVVVALAAVISLIGFGLCCFAGSKIYQALQEEHEFPWSWGGAFLVAATMTIAPVLNGAFSLLFVS